jgi:hypothetical protein
LSKESHEIAESIVGLGDDTKAIILAFLAGMAGVDPDGDLASALKKAIAYAKGLK